MPDDNPEIVVTGPSGSNGDIVVNGPSGWSVTWNGLPWSGGGDGGWDSGSAGQQGGGDPVIVTDFQFVISASCSDSAAIAVAGSLSHSGANWGGQEYTSVIYKGQDGRFHLVDNTVFTDGMVDQATPFYPQGTMNVGAGYEVYYTEIGGVFHNHPDELGDDIDDLINRYPSDDDWTSFRFHADDRYGGSHENYDPSIYIMDARGVLREFSLSMIDYYINLSDVQKQMGVGLPVPVVGCDGF